MRLRLAPHPLLQLIAAILLTPSPLVVAKPRPASELLAGFSFDELFARYDCGGQLCGYSSQLCCSAGSTCYTNADDQAACSVGATTVGAAASGGYWQVYTTVYVETDFVTTTQVYSSYVSQTTVAAATAQCQYALNETPCGNICCASNQYCYVANTCSPVAGGSSGYYTTYTPPSATGIAPILGTSSTNVLITTTARPTTTVPFVTPVATGSNITLTNNGSSSNSGLSGGAIAGIVIGVLVGLFLLALILFYCCLRGLLDGCLAFFGLRDNRRRRRRTTEVEEYERRSHRDSRGVRRTWYGAVRPARETRYEERDRRDGGLGWLGIAGGLAALWAFLSFSRQRDRRRREEEKYSEESYHESDYYTSEESASSDDRRTRNTRLSRR